MNMFPGTVRVAGGNASVEADDGTTLPLASGQGYNEGARVIYGVRPEYLTLANGAGGGFNAEVTVVEPTGADILVIGKAAGTEVRASFHERHEFVPGQQIALHPRLDTVHLFDEASGNRVA